MKRLIVAIICSIGMLFAFAPTASADWAYGHVNIGGSAADFAWSGDAGAMAGFEGEGGYGAWGPNYAEGGIVATGFANANAFDAGWIAGSYAEAGLFIEGYGIGWLAAVGMEGGVGQFNYAEVSSPWTYAWGTNQSQAEAAGFGIEFFGYEYEAIGAYTEGGTLAWQWADTNTVYAGAYTWNNSMAGGDYSQVSGSGEVGGGAVNYGSTGGGIAEGGAGFSYSGQNFGGGQAWTNNQVTVNQGANSIQVQSSQFSGASSGAF